MRREPIDLLVVGPVGRKTGGIARYIAEQTRHLPDEVRVDHHDTGALGGDRDGSLLQVVVQSLLALVRYPFRSRPDVVHVHTAEAFSFYRNAVYVLWAKYVWRVPVVLHVHGPTFDEFVAEASPPVRALQRAVFDASDRIVVLSEHWREVLSARADPGSLVVLPNAVVPEDYDPRYGADPPHLVFVADHVHRKGIQDLVRALECLPDDASFRATIAGTGPLADRAERLADEYENVEYAGYVSEAEKHELLSSASAYVLPTHAEGLPIGMLEAMAGGNAVVSTAVGAIPEVIDEDGGVVLPPGDPEALAAALAELVAAPDRLTAMGRHNRRTVEDRYAWSETSDRLVALYREVLADDPRERTEPTATGSD